MIEVKNMRTYKGIGEYVGRPSPLGNPFPIGPDESRETVIQRYHTWLRSQLEYDTSARKEFERLQQIYRDTGSLILICWCAPLPCHADVIRRMILDREKNRSQGNVTLCPA